MTTPAKTSPRTYHGSCHCGALRFEVDLDLAAGTTRCNCSFCAKTRHWGIIVPPTAFRLLAGEAALGDYQFGGFFAHHQFCTRCGVRPFSRGELEVFGGAYVNINIGCLDDATPEELGAAPIVYLDGRNDEWERPPAVTGYI